MVKLRQGGAGAAPLTGAPKHAIPQTPPDPRPAAGFVTSFMNDGVVDVDRVADAFRMSKGQLARTAGLGTASVSKANRRVAPKAQTRVTEMLEIIGRVRDWSGGEAQAMAWYRSQPLPALDGRTAEALVKDGRASAVRDCLDPSPTVALLEVCRSLLPRPRSDLVVHTTVRSGCRNDRRSVQPQG